MLGVPWNKTLDRIQVIFPAPIEKLTKREVLGKLAKIYDPLGLSITITLEGKCFTEPRVNQALPKEHMPNWQMWETNLPDKVKVERNIVQH